MRSEQVSGRTWAVELAVVRAGQLAWAAEMAWGSDLASVLGWVLASRWVLA